MYKRIFKIFLIVFSIIVILAFSITTYFAEDIENSVKNKIQESLNVPLTLEDIQLTLFGNFPSTSLKTKNLLILEAKGFNNDTLLFTKEGYIEINLFDIIRNKYKIKNIIISDAKINIKYDTLDTPNFLIIKKQNESRNNFSIKKITIRNSNVNIDRAKNKFNMNWILNKSSIVINDLNYSFIVDGFSKNLNIEKQEYLSEKRINIHAETKIQKDTISILTSKVKLEKILLDVSGNIINGNMLNLNISAKEEEINQIVTHLPSNIKQIYEPVFLSGQINFNSTLSGLISKEENPFFKMDYEISNGNFILKSNNFKLSNLKMSGYVNNGKEQNFKSTIIQANEFNANTENVNITGGFTIENLNNYFLTADFKSSWDLEHLNSFFKNSPFSKINGELFTTTTYSGNIAFDMKFKRHFLNSIHQSDIKFKNVTFNYKASPVVFNFKEADGKINNHKISLNKCIFTSGKTDLNFKGETIDFFGYLLEEKPNFYINGAAISEHINFSELIQDSNEQNIKQQIIPEWIDANIKFNIKELLYKNFNAKNVTGLILHENGKLNVKNLNAQLLNGEINTEFTLSEPINNHLKLVGKVLMKKINIRSSFDTFNNYGQNFILKEHLKGIGSAEIDIEAHWLPNFILEPEKLKITSHLIIEEGELINFTPLENLSSYVSLEELKHVRFSTLENTIDIANSVITIPKMEIKSSALSVFLSGTHTFDQTIDYEITLLLSELLSNSFRQSNTKITEFGEEKKEGKIFNTIYLKMTGKTNDPKIYLNKIRFMEDLEKTIEQEKEIIKNIINEDVLQQGEKETEDDINEDDIEIEWDPEK